MELLNRFEKSSILIDLSWSKFLGGNGNRLLTFKFILDLWFSNGRKAFPIYFKKPSKSKYYKPGQSISEVLPITEAELKTALHGTKKQGLKNFSICTRITKGQAKKEGYTSSTSFIRHLLASSNKLEHLILTLTDVENRQWYFVNEKLLNKLITDHYKVGEETDVFEIYNLANTEDKDEEVNLPKRTFTEQQMSIIRASKLKPDFELDTEYIKMAEGMGYRFDDIKHQFRSFKHYYVYGNGINKKSGNWADLFVNVWLDNAFRFGKITRNDNSKGDTQYEETVRLLRD